MCSIDGSLTRVPDSDANRQAYGSAGTADGSSPYPQLRELRCSQAPARATLAVAAGPSGAGAGGGRDKGEAGQVLPGKAVKDSRHVLTPGRLRVMDRNYPGVLRIKALPETGTHVLIRVRDGITLHRHGEFPPDGSYLASITGSGATLTVRVIEYHIRVAGRDAAELFCLITDLHDHQAYPAQMLAAAYHWRWAGSETTLKRPNPRSAEPGPAGPPATPQPRSASADRSPPDRTPPFLPHSYRPVEPAAAPERHPDLTRCPHSPWPYTISTHTAAHPAFKTLDRAELNGIAFGARFGATTERGAPSAPPLPRRTRRSRNPHRQR